MYTKSGKATGESWIRTSTRSLVDNGLNYGSDGGLLWTSLKQVCLHCPTFAIVLVYYAFTIDEARNLTDTKHLSKTMTQEAEESVMIGKQCNLLWFHFQSCIFSTALKVSVPKLTDNTRISLDLCIHCS